MSYLDPFMQQWKTYLKQQFSQCGLSYTETDSDDSVDIKANSLVYFCWLRTTSRAGNNFDEARDGVAWEGANKSSW